MLKRICGVIYLDLNYNIVNPVNDLEYYLDNIVEKFNSYYKNSNLYYNIVNLDSYNIPIGILLYGEGEDINEKVVEDIIDFEFSNDNTLIAIRSLSIDVFEYDRFR